MFDFINLVQFEDIFHDYINLIYKLVYSRLFQGVYLPPLRTEMMEKVWPF